jgi:dTDP-4-dehydrorhamnose reductase
MKFLVTGAEGQLGRAAVDNLSLRGIEVVPTDIPELPVEDKDMVRAVFAEHRPTHVVHCGAVTDVDGCELDPDLAQSINGVGTGNVAAACEEVGAALVYVSTDFVFDGQGDRPYRHDDPPAPVSVYGASKLAGERAVLDGARADFFVARSSWLFGPGGRNFPLAILNRARAGQPLRVVDDQLGCPSMTRDVAPALVDLVLSGAAPGIYHVANEGSCSWHEFACEILAGAGIAADVGTMTSSELARPARRPAYSVLDCSRLTAVRGQPLPSYKDALRRYLEEETR